MKSWLSLARSHRYLLIPLLALAFFPLTERGQLGPENQPGREDGTWRSLNNYTLIFLEPWRQSGAFRSHLGLKIPMDDTDYSFVKSYSSYPAGYLLLPFALEKLSPIPLARDSRSTLWRIQALARVNHFLLACLAGWAALALAGQLTAAFAAALAVLFLPPFLLFQHNVWWTDMLGITLACLVLLLHIRLRQAAAQGPAEERRLALAVLAGGLVDWFTPMFSGIVAIVSPKRRRLLILTAIAIAALLFLYQQYLQSSLQVVLYKFRIRTSIQPEGFTVPWLLNAWLETVRRFMGPGALLIPPLALGIAALFKEGRRRLRIFWPFPAAVLAHWLLFNQHYPGHHYNTIRWALVLALLPSLFPRRFGHAAALLLLVWVASVYPRYGAALDVTATDLPPAHLSACRLVERNRAPEHYFVSEEFSFSHELMGYLWYFPWCKSMVAKASNMDDAVEAVRKRLLRFGFQVRAINRMFLLTTKAEPPAWAVGARAVDNEGGWTLFEFTLKP